MCRTFDSFLKLLIHLTDAWYVNRILEFWIVFFTNLLNTRSYRQIEETSVRSLISLWYLHACLSILQINSEGIDSFKKKCLFISAYDPSCFSFIDLFPHLSNSVSKLFPDSYLCYESIQMINFLNYESFEMIPKHKYE